MSNIQSFDVSLGDTFVPSVRRRLDDGSYAFDLAVFDLYRDIHKGLRVELFDVTATAGRTDPGDRVGTLALVEHVRTVADSLDHHAHHEDEAIEPALRLHLPELAERINNDHAALDASIRSIVEVAQALGATAGAFEQRRLGHLLHLELSAFTAAYLVHQLVEERVVNPALERKVGVEGVIAIQQAIIGSMPPELLGQSLSVMLPAMNLDDRAELLGGMRQSAPPEAFAGVTNLARSVLQPTDFANLADRLSLN